MTVTGAPEINEPFATELEHLQHHRDLEDAADAGAGVTPSTVFEALLPLGKIGTAPGFIGGSALYDPDRVLGAVDTGVLPFHWHASGGVKLGAYVGDLSDDNAVICEMEGLSATLVNFTAYEWNVGAAEIKMELQGGDHAFFGVRAAAGQTIPVFQAADDQGTAKFRVMQTGAFGAFGVTPPAQGAAYTQTYATADRTHATATAATLTDNSAGTANTTLEALVSGSVYATDVAAIRNNFADLAAMVNKLIVDQLDTKQLVNAVIDDLQAFGLAG